MAEYDYYNDDEENIELVLEDKPESEETDESKDAFDESPTPSMEDEVGEIERLKRYGLSTNENGFYCDNKKFYEAMCDYKQKVYAYREVHDKWLAEREAIRIHDGLPPEKKTKVSDEVKAKSEELSKNLTEEMKQEFLSHPEPSKPIIPDYVAKCILAIAVHLSYRPNFNGYTYKEEFIADAIENCVKYIDNFNEQYATKNPFSYFTTICWQAFIRRIQIERNQSVVKGRLIKGMTMDNTMVIDEDVDKQILDDTMRNNHRFVAIAEEEERKMAEKENEKKKAKEEKRKRVFSNTPFAEYFS